MSTLYDNINLLCMSEGITGYRLCKDLGISPSVITDLKKGRKKGLSADYAEKIAAYFDVSVSYLLRDPSQIGKPVPKSNLESALREHYEQKKEKPAPKDELSDKDIKLLAWFRSLSPEKQQAILTAQDAPEGLV